MPIEQVPAVQKELLKQAGYLARPSITATQMLDSMVTSSRPTRAEVADVANAILDGTDAVMLSQETAIGAYPVGAVEMMAAVAVQAEAIAPYEDWNASRVRRAERDPAHTVAHSLCLAARELQLDALIVPTLSGRSARLPLRRQRLLSSGSTGASARTGIGVTRVMAEHAVSDVVAQAAVDFQIGVAGIAVRQRHHGPAGCNG